MIYFDNSATTQPYPEVLDSFMKVSQRYFGNPSSLHSLGAEAEKLLSQSRKQAADLLGVRENEVFFTSGGTEGNNLAIKGAAVKHSKRGRHIISTAVEHPSVKEALEQIREELDFEITYLGVDEEGRISLEELVQALRPDTILVSIMHVNNETGTIQPIEEAGAILSKYPKVLFHVDHVQGAGKVRLDIQRCKIDLLTLSSHKVHGLKGNGILYIRNGVQISPLFAGGSQESRFRSGTENVAGIVAMARALRITMTDMDIKTEEIDRIRKRIRDGISSMDSVSMNTPSDGSAPHILNFSVPGINTEVVVRALQEREIFVSTTSACSSKKKASSSTVLAMFKDSRRADSTLRISLSSQNTMEEAEHFISAAEDILTNLREVMR
ncbi:cysteine desulfurase family protein [Peribacillus kribbensis]|uniref:cysteine desulfurase family protein n=1 Tax=Peribacillus kribbensis TaxID=356658 RepID=UPI0004237179|nr:cysteine desulfurase family protein [Peribacillus kribbensis]